MTQQSAPDGNSLEIRAGRDEVQRFDVRLYFPPGKDPEEIRNAVNDALQSDALYELISAYELVSDGFGGLMPGGEGPLA